MIDSAPSSARSGTAQAAVFLGPGRPLELRRFALPEPGAEEALVRVECCTICGSDLHTIRGARVEPVPSILGHEILGVIETVGDPPPQGLDGQRLGPGERITWSTSVACGRCDRCGRGLPQKCRTLAKYGHERAEGRLALSGGLAEYLLLRRGSSAVRVAREIAAEVICPVNCATATVAAAVRAAGTVAGRRVLILGAGMLGLTAAAFARSSGASTVAVTDLDPRRLERATLFGADRAIEWPPAIDEAFDVALELSGSPEAVEAALRLGDIGAHVVLVGSVMPSRPVAIDPEYLVRRWLSVHGVHNYAPDDLRRAVAFLEGAGRAYPFGALVERTYPLAEVNAAIETALRTRPIRVGVRP
jgi:putative phosphonate catabolism associated alcohol dehydrogenase